MQTDQFTMDWIVTAAALPCMKKQQNKITTSIETLLLRLTDIQTSLNTNITRTDNNTHELLQLLPRLYTQFKAIHIQFDHTNTDIEYNNKFNRSNQDSTSEPPTVRRLETQIAKLVDILTANTASEKEFRQINSVSLTNINNTIQFVES